MNERIRELADQILPNEKEFHRGDPKDWGYFFSGEELEKFAELIIRECVQFAYKEADHLEDEFERGRADDLRRWANVMKQHFGVES